MRFVVTARQHFTGGRDDTAAPYTPAELAQFAAVIVTVGTLDVAAVTRIGRHKRMSVGVVIELGGFERQTIRAKRFIDAPELRPFVLVGAKAKALEFDEN